MGRDIPGWQLALGLIAMFVVYELARGLPSFSDPEGALRLMAGDMAMLAAPMIFGWVIAAIPEVIARRRGGQRTRLRRNTLIATGVLCLLMIVGQSLERRDHARAPTPAEQGAKADMDARVSEFVERASRPSASLPVQVSCFPDTRVSGMTFTQPLAAAR